MSKENEEVYFTLKVYRGPKNGLHKFDNGTEVDNYPFKFDLEFTYPFNPVVDKLSQNRPLLITKDNLAVEMESIFNKLGLFFKFVSGIHSKETVSDTDAKFLKLRTQQLEKLKIILENCDNINRLTYSQFSRGYLNVGTNVTLPGNGDMKPPRG
jgi:hypothetical protein